PDEGRHLRRLQFDTRNLRFGSGRGRIATWHHQQIAPLDDPDGGATDIEPFLLGLRKHLMRSLFVDNGSDSAPKDIRGWMDDGFHEFLDGGINRTVPGNVARCRGRPGRVVAIAAWGSLRDAAGTPHFWARLCVSLLGDGE